MNLRFEHLELLEAVQAFTLNHGDARLEPFKDDMRGWGDDWVALPPAYLPAADLLDTAAAEAGCDALVTLFNRQRQNLHWEQSYRRTEGLAPEAMLDAYAFAEIIGKQGPFISDRIRAGIGIWGPGVDYPRHQHEAEEIYIPLSGAAIFEIGDAPPRRWGRAEVIHVPSNTPHGFHTEDEMLVVFYLWRAGDLRQQSRFD